MTKELQFLCSEFVRATSPALRLLARLKLRIFPVKPGGLNSDVLNGIAQASIKAGEAMHVAAKEFVKLKTKFDFVDAVKYTNGPAPSNMYHHLEFTVGQMAEQCPPGMTIEAKIQDQALVSGPNGTDLMGLDQFLRHERPGHKFVLDMYRSAGGSFTVLRLKHLGLVQPEIDPILTNFGLNFNAATWLDEHFVPGPDTTRDQDELDGYAN